MLKFCAGYNLLKSSEINCISLKKMEKMAKSMQKVATTE